MHQWEPTDRSERKILKRDEGDGEESRREVTF